MIDLWRRLRERWLASDAGDIALSTPAAAQAGEELSAHLRRDIGLCAGTPMRNHDPIWSQALDRRMDPRMRSIRPWHNYHPRMFLQLHRSDE